MKRQYRKRETGFIGTIGIGGLFAYLTGVIQGHIWGVIGDHRTVKRIGRRLLPAAVVLALMCLIVHLTAPILPLKKVGAEMEAPVAHAAEEGEAQELIVADNKMPSISVGLQNQEEWCQKNIIYVSVEDDLPVEYRYIPANSGLDSGWITQSSKDVTANGTWTIMVRDAAGNMAEQEITVDNIDNSAPVIHSITEKQKERQ